jgi:outer membrane lipoprotein-sorting protein
MKSDSQRFGQARWAYNGADFAAKKGICDMRLSFTLPGARSESMHRKHFVKLTFCIGLILGISPAIAGQTPMPQPFSADFTMTSGAGGELSSGKIYFSLPKMRMESSSKGQEAIMIMDQSVKTMYMLMPKQRMYLESHMDQQNPMMRQGPKAPTSFDPNHPCGANEKCEKVGTETVNGRVCDKWVTTGTKGTSTAWIDQKLTFPIKAQSANGEIWQLTNIKEGKPDASLFELPAGYQKMVIPGMAGGAPPPQ